MHKKLILCLAVIMLAACGAPGTGSSQGSTAASTTTSTAASTPASTAASATVSTAASTPASATGDASTQTAGGTLRVGLDWTPNTNHTGLYIARDQGLYRAQEMDVQIQQAQEGGTVEQLVASGKLDVGVSYQEGVTQARAEGLPVVSIAAVIQHNTSGFASRKSANIASVKDWEGKKYGAFGGASERAVIEGLMKCAGADVNKVQFVDIGSTDFFVATERGDVDFAWIFQGWTGIEAQQRSVALNMIMLNDLHCIPDYYTPVLITNEKMIAEHPDVLRRFMHATSQGYQFAISHPDEAAQVLVKAAPELDKDLVTNSQRYLAKEYQADAPRWGEQKPQTWHDYAQWMADRKLIKSMLKPEQAFTNQFLP